MARLDIAISDELDGWIRDEAKRRGSNKTAVVASILEAARKAPEADPAPDPERPGPEPEEPGKARIAPDRDPDPLRKVAVTLDLLFRRYLADHPATPRTEAEKEVAEARWQAVEAIRNQELSK
jgi:hypothetical protein